MRALNLYRTPFAVNLVTLQCAAAILGVNFYMDRDPEHFGSFFRALFTVRKGESG